MCTSLRALVAPLIKAMWEDALKAPYLCTDATGVLVQALEKCRNAHFFVVAAPDKHVLFGYTQKHNAQAVGALLGGYSGYLVADAHSVYNHLYRDGDVVEVGCWAHARRYFFKALGTEPVLAQEALTLIGGLFAIERAHQSESLEARMAARERESRPLLNVFFAWCEEKVGTALDETPIRKAIGYAQNQKEALSRFLDDARLPLHNNFSERALRHAKSGSLWAATKVARPTRCSCRCSQAASSMASSPRHTCAIFFASCRVGRRATLCASRPRTGKRPCKTTRLRSFSPPTSFARSASGCAILILPRHSAPHAAKARRDSSNGYNFFAT